MVTTVPIRAPAPARPAVEKAPVLLLAVASGLTVANTYYAQPLLEAIARDLGVGATTAGLVVPLGQVGYVLGLVLLVPLGDLLDRRRLITGALLAATGALLLVATAPRIGLVDAGIVLVGFTSVAAQILVPFAAILAADHERGRVVGQVMTGLLLGTLLSRGVAGLIAQVAGWRTVYVVAAVVTAALTVLISRSLPHHPPTTGHRYRHLLVSVALLMAREPVLRLRSVFGALAFAAFNILWTPIAFVLAAPPYGFAEAAIGAFALASVPTVFLTGFVGRLGDLGYGRSLTGVYFAVVLAGAGLAAFGARHLVALTLGALLVTLGQQCVHITNQSEIYRLAPGARCRVTTAYMASYFGGGIAGSALAMTVYAARGWDGVCVLLGCVTAVALLIWATDRLRSSAPVTSPGVE
ncbi:MFS transporter [Actinomadura sp. HBU206391]|uniref:MFS transporter n=1 Tax=Actinomadura sp. HBU206391 TaxID=2731692 RepID=UPI00164FF7C2|nr:MFS transporter [Actinomadura sp. HBU206391]MBC6461757.1 MFS transporter [Actinomadura sp. HBU206391]